MKKERILVLDIETAPILSHIWSLWEEPKSTDKIVKDWHLMSWAAKYVGEREVHYMDQRLAKDIEDDSDILVELHNLIEEADVVVTHNGKKFDIKKINTRLALHNLFPIKKVKQVDTLSIVKSNFAFTSNKLEYLAQVFKIAPKDSHKKYPGLSLWKACLEGDTKAWKAMEKYNKQDVVTTEALYKKLIAWDKTTDFSVIRDNGEAVCACGNDHFFEIGKFVTASKTYLQYRCEQCGKLYRSSESTSKKLTRVAL